MSMAKYIQCTKMYCGVFQVTFELFTAFKMFFNNCQILYMLYNKFLYTIFNPSQRTVKLNPAWDVLKIMLKKLEIMMMEMTYRIDVD